MKRTVAILTAPLLLAACMEDTNPIEDNAANVYGWYQTHNANLSEAPVPREVQKECGDAVMAGKSSDPACEQFATYFTAKINSSAVLNETVEPQHWYSKNFWGKWLETYERSKQDSPTLNRLQQWRDNQK